MAWLPVTGSITCGNSRSKSKERKVFLAWRHNPVKLPGVNFPFFLPSSPTSAGTGRPDPVRGSQKFHFTFSSSTQTHQNSGPILHSSILHSSSTPSLSLSLCLPWLCILQHFTTDVRIVGRFPGFPTW